MNTIYVLSQEFRNLFEPSHNPHKMFTSVSLAEAWLLSEDYELVRMPINYQFHGEVSLWLNSKTVAGGFRLIIKAALYDSLSDFVKEANA